MPVKEFIKAKEKISEFTNKESVEFLSNFFIYFEEELNNISSDRIRECLRNKFGNFILELNVNFSKEEVNKLWFVQMFENMKNSKYPDYASRTWKIVFIYFLKENFYNDKQLDFFVKKMDYVVDILNVHETIIPILTSDNSPYFFDYIKLKSRISNNLGVSLLKYDFNDEFLKNLLYRFIEEHFEKYISTNTQPFFNEFGKSLNMKLPNSIYEFNINTLRSQAEYFKEYHRETLTTLKYFYIFILNLQGNTPTITLKDGIDINFLSSKSFYEFYYKNYKVIPFNIFEKYPDCDNWMLMPNGTEILTSSEKSNKYIPLSFEDITDLKLKDACKSWCWEDKSSIKNKTLLLYYVKNFLDFRDNLRKNNITKFIDAKTEGVILTEEVFAYVSHIENIWSGNTIKTCCGTIKSFLTYLIDNNLYEVDSISFEYLVNKGSTTLVENIPSIPTEDFEKLIVILEEKAKTKDLYMLYYILFCIASLTPLRINTIVDLNIDSVVEKGRTGIYAIKTVDKTSNGDKRDIQISPNVKRLIEVAINITEKIRIEAPKELKNFIFLTNNYKYKYSPVSAKSFSNYISKISSSIGLPKYSAENLRKKYMTTIVENAIKKNVSLMKLKDLTGHASIDTTENHYVKTKIRDYLEATRHVEIGNIEVVGEVVEEYDDGLGKTNIVNEECGYCRNDECNIMGTINCLRCKGFVTTPSHIPFFNEAISNLNIKINNTTSEHDREHLYAVKRLYVAYLEKLYLKKEDMNI